MNFVNLNFVRKQICRELNKDVYSEHSEAGLYNEDHYEYELQDEIEELKEKLNNFQCYNEMKTILYELVQNSNVIFEKYFIFNFYQNQLYTMLEQYSNQVLKTIIQKYNLHTIIKNYSVMKKPELIKAILDHLHVVDGQITIKPSVANYKMSLKNTKKMVSKVSLNNTKKKVSKASKLDNFVKLQTELELLEQEYDDNAKLGWQQEDKITVCEDSISALKDELKSIEEKKIEYIKKKGYSVDNVPASVELKIESEFEEEKQMYEEDIRKNELKIKKYEKLVDKYDDIGYDIMDKIKALEKHDPKSILSDLKFESKSLNKKFKNITAEMRLEEWKKKHGR